MLTVENIQSFYGESQVLFDISLSVKPGKVVTLLGRNGMGKTTSIKSIMGIIPIHSGSVQFDNQELTGLASYQIARLGLGLVPEGRQIFPNLSVRENLIATEANRLGKSNPWTLHRVLDFFPVLKDRLGNLGVQLSGGEQQMLAIGRALMLNPSLLILDEATEGLAPLVRKEIWARLYALKEQGLSLLIVDKNLKDLLPLADWHYVIEKGKTVWSGSSQDIDQDTEVKRRYLGV